MTVVTICQLCQHSNKHGRTRCARCNHAFDTPTEIARTKLQGLVYGSNTLFKSLVAFEVFLLIAAFFFVPSFVGVLVFFGVMGAFTMLAKERRDFWRRNATLFAEKHPELAKAEVVPQ